MDYIKSVLGKWPTEEAEKIRGRARSFIGMEREPLQEYLHFVYMNLISLAVNSSPNVQPLVLAKASAIQQLVADLFLDDVPKINQQF